jgi:hypothetical protein
VSAATIRCGQQNNSFINIGLTCDRRLARLLLRCWQGDQSHDERTAILQETIMNTRTSSKLAAFAIALMMNSFIIGGVAYLFDAQTQQHSSLISLAKQIATFQWLI